jgi:hypothetical protein
VLAAELLSKTGGVVALAYGIAAKHAKNGDQALAICFGHLIVPPWTFIERSRPSRARGAWRGIAAPDRDRRIVERSSPWRGISRTPAGY